MLQHPLAIIAVLIGIVWLVLFLSHHPATKKFFRFIPFVFWIYFLPMVLATVGILDPKHPIYSELTKYLLPASLFLLLVTVDVFSIMRLGIKALLMFFAGSIGMAIGAVVMFYFFRNMLGEEMWSGFAALVGSWTGGSANMIAVKEALNTPDSVFLPMVIVDNIVPYTWMAMLLAAVVFQSTFDRWNKSELTVLEDLRRKTQLAAERKMRMSFVSVILLLLIGGAVSLLVQWIAGFLPVIKDVISASAWMIIIASLLALVISLTSVRQIEVCGSNPVGNFLLYLVLTTIGAKASLSHMSEAGWLLLAGAGIAVIHGIILVITARLLRAPMFLAVTASQANIGGMVSAPVVAGLYQPGLASVGLLMAITGNIFGTYIGILTGQICRFIAIGTN